MPIERYFCEASFRVGESQELRGAEFHHLAHVMRACEGEEVELINGRGVLAKAIVLELTKADALLRIESLFQEPERPYRLILAQALPKPNRLDFILEKGTELGVDDFWLFPGHLSVKKECYPHQLERAQAVTIAAMKQCGRLTLPVITPQPIIEEWSLPGGLIFFGDLKPGAPPFQVVWEQLPALVYPLIFVTGPESGFSQKEVERLKDRGARGVKLHENILRTDTASLMALSLLSHWLFLQSTKK